MAPSAGEQHRHPHVAVAVDGSSYADEALQWAADAAHRRGSALRIVCDWLPVPGLDGWSAARRQARGILDEGRARALAHAPDLDVAVAEHQGAAGPALAAEGETAAMLVVGSRGRGGFRSLLLGSTSLAAAATALCPVVVVRGRQKNGAADRPVVVGVDAVRPAPEVLGFGFAEAALLPGAALRVVYGWRPETWAPSGAGPAFTAAEIEAAAERGLAEATAGHAEDHPHVKVHRELSPGSAAAALVDASADAALTVVGRRVAGTGLGPVAQGVLLHADGPVAVVPHR